MTDKQLPRGPDLEQLKRQAKELQQSRAPCMGANATRARIRIRVLEQAARRGRSALARIRRRSHGVSGSGDRWPLGRAERILALHPKIGPPLYNGARIGDASAVHARLTKDRSLATTAGDPRRPPGSIHLPHSGGIRSPRDIGAVSSARRRPEHALPCASQRARPSSGARRASAQSLRWSMRCRRRRDPNDGSPCRSPRTPATSRARGASLRTAQRRSALATDGSTALYAIANGAAPGRRTLAARARPDPTRCSARTGETPAPRVARAWTSAVASDRSFVSLRARRSRHRVRAPW